MPARALHDAHIRREVGSHVADARRSVGWSQERLAEAIGVDKLLISRLETGRRALTVPMALSLARSLGVSVGQLLGLQVPNEDLTGEVATLLAAMPPQRRGTALRILRELAREGPYPDQANPLAARGPDQATEA